MIVCKRKLKPSFYPSIRWKRHDPFLITHRPTTRFASKCKIVRCDSYLHDTSKEQNDKKKKKKGKRQKIRIPFSKRSLFGHYTREKEKRRRRIFLYTRPNIPPSLPASSLPQSPLPPPSTPPTLYLIESSSPPPPSSHQNSSFTDSRTRETPDNNPLRKIYR